MHRGRFTPGRPVKPWILGIAINLARNRLRWWRKRPGVALDEWMELAEEPSPEVPAGAAGLERAERARAVRDAIAQLPTKLQEALVLFEYEYMSYSEIAQAVGATAKAVENRIARARERLREELSELRIP